MRSAEELRQHIRALGHAFGIAVAEQAWEDPLQRFSGVSSSPDRVVIVPDVRDHVCYAVALHEIGHVRHPAGNLSSPRREITAAMDAEESPMTLTFIRLAQRLARVKLEEEHNAWEWATANAMEWTPEMTTAQQWALKTYEETIEITTRMEALAVKTKVWTANMNPDVVQDALALLELMLRDRVPPDLKTA